MNNKVIIGLFVVIFLALGGAGFAWFRNNVSSPASNSNTESVVEVSASSSAGLDQQSSLKDLWSSGVSQKCTFNDGNTTGITYISDGKMKGDFSSSINGQITTSHMIVEGNSSYIWMDNQTQGFKVSIENVSKQVGASSSGTIDLNRQFNVQCQKEAVDQSQFRLPQNIQFQDMSSIQQTNIQTNNSPTTDIKAAQCGACDKLPGPAKEQCQKALAC